jgi:hypothetical protein
MPQAERREISTKVRVRIELINLEHGNQMHNASEIDDVLSSRTPGWDVPEICTEGIRH